MNHPPHPLHVKLAATQLLLKKAHRRTKTLSQWTVIAIISLALTSTLNHLARQLEGIYSWLTWPLGILWFVALMSCAILAAIWCFVTVPQEIATQTAIAHTKFKLRSRADTPPDRGALAIYSGPTQEGELSLERQHGHLTIKREHET